MAHAIFISRLVTEYDDGTEEVRFTEDEARVMAADPVYYGYAFEGCGHATQGNEGPEGCILCFNINEARSEEDRLDN